MVGYTVIASDSAFDNVVDSKHGVLCSYSGAHNEYNKLTSCTAGYCSKWGELTFKIFRAAVLEEDELGSEADPILSPGCWLGYFHKMNAPANTIDCSMLCKYVYLEQKQHEK